jgi:hypothetical protein
MAGKTLALMQDYAYFKVWLSQSYGLAEDLLHVHAGLIIFFATALLFQRRMRSLIPISIVYALAIANEIVDVMTPGKSAPQWEPLVDILNTVVWPTLLFLLARRRIKRTASESPGVAEEIPTQSEADRT